MKFSQLETKDDLDLIDEQSSSLADWYRDVRDVDIGELELEDLCRAVRQRLFVAAVIPACVQHLQADIFAGDDYEGQLICSLTSLTTEDWKKAPKEANIIKELVIVGLSGALVNSDLVEDANQVIARINGADSGRRGQD